MKRKITTACALLLMALSMHAQVYKEVDKTPGERLGTLLKDFEKGMKKTGESLSDLLGLEGKTDSTLIEIDGVRYMPVYTVDRFTADSLSMYEACRKDFAKRYNAATIVSVAIPQEDWLETVVMENKKVAMYKRKAYCYVLGKDGKDGYINARYSFIQYRKPGNRWLSAAGYWPKFERADAIPIMHYKRLKKK